MDKQLIKDIIMYISFAIKKTVKKISCKKDGAEVEFHESDE